MFLGSLNAINIFSVQVDFVRSLTTGDQLREDDRLALETLLANVPQCHAVKGNSVEITPQLSPASTPANKRNKLPLGMHYM